ncbi:hypothetical protein ACFRQM_13195 [Streptomyces sp. NPDC056831]|uniref:nSTAND1 domain-containing NTPase n=1 Tax=Streptomyces sp. NPDC056831 TaxID=3345954 RepID=UPI00369419E3
MDPAAGAVQMFAHELRKLRHRAGSPTYRAMARHAPFSAPTLSAAAAGERLPSLPVALAYAAACGGEAAHWEERWRAAASSEPAAAEEQGTAGAPYPGLARFEPGDPLYGRDELTDDIRELTRRHRFAAVVGASGSGKSSLLRAGLIPALRTDSGTPLAVIRVLTPGEHPARTHRELLTPSTEPDAGGDTMIVVDQFEEVFALCHDPAERAEFIDLLLAACDPASRLRVLVAVRADFFGRCAEHHALALALRDATVLVGPMAPAQLREAIVGPASAERLVVERALTARLVAEVVDEPGGLPLMSHALLEVWRRRRGRTLTLAAYEAIGGIQGAVAHTAEEVISGFTPQQARTARSLLLRLISPGDGTQDTRRPTPRDELGTSPGTALVLEQLVRARLLTADATTVDLAHEALILGWPRLRGWIEEDRERLRLHRRLTDAARIWQGLGRDEGALFRGAQLSAAGEAFGEPAELTDLEDAFLTASIEARDRSRRSEIRTTRRLRGLSVALSLLLCLAVVAGLLAWQQSRTSARRATEAEALRIAAVADTMRHSDPRTALRLSVAAWRIADLPRTREALFGAAAQRELDVFASPTTDFLPNEDNGVWRRTSQDGRTLTVVSPDRTRRWDVASHRELPSYPGLGKHADHIVDVSPDTRSVVIRTPTGLRVWDLAAGRPTGPVFGPPEGSTGWNSEGAFTPGGRTFAVRENHRVITLWNLRDGRLLSQIPLHGSEARGLVVSPDGKLLAFCPETGPVQVWDTRRRSRLRTPGAARTHACDMDGATFTPDSRALAFRSGTGVRMWDVRTGYERRRIPVTDPSEFVFSRDGAYAATLSATEALLWRTADLSAPVLRQPLSGAGFGRLTLDIEGRVLRYEEGTAPAIAVRSTSLDGVLSPGRLQEPLSRARFSPDGRTLATGTTLSTPHGKKYEVRLRDAATGRQDAVFTGPSCEGCGRLMAFSPDSRTFAHQSGPTTVSVHPHGSLLQVSDLVGISLDDRSVTVSRSSAGGETIEVGKLKGDPAWSTVYRKRDGSVVATAPDGRFLTELGQSVEPESGRARRVLRGESVVATADYSPDGQYLAMADFFGRVTLWDGAGRRRLAVLAPGADGGLPQPALAFSADSRSVAVGSPDGSVRMWSTEDPGSQGAPLPAADGPVLALAFGAQDSRLRVTTPYTALRTYPLAPSVVAAAVCSRSRGGLSKNEWQAHLPDVGYRTIC